MYPLPSLGQNGARVKLRYREYLVIYLGSLSAASERHEHTVLVCLGAILVEAFLYI